MYIRPSDRSEDKLALLSRCHTGHLEQRSLYMTANTLSISGAWVGGVAIALGPRRGFLRYRGARKSTLD